MFRWIKNLFRKREYRNSTTLYNFLSHYTDSEKELTAMKNFIRENNTNSEYWDCEYYKVEASKTIRKRYGLYQYHVGFVWFLLEEFYKGNVIIKKDAQPKP